MKLSRLVLIPVVSLVLVACGNGAQNNDSNTSKNVEIATDAFASNLTTSAAPSPEVQEIMNLQDQLLKDIATAEQELAKAKLQIESISLAEPGFEAALSQISQIIGPFVDLVSTFDLRFSEIDIKISELTTATPTELKKINSTQKTVISRINSFGNNVLDITNNFETFGLLKLKQRDLNSAVLQISTTLEDVAAEFAAADLPPEKRAAGERRLAQLRSQLAALNKQIQQANESFDVSRFRTSDATKLTKTLNAVEASLQSLNQAIADFAAEFLP